MKFFALVAAGCVAASMAKMIPDKEVECDGLESGTACSYIDPSGTNQTGACALETDTNSPLYNQLLCTKPLHTGSGSDGQAEGAPTAPPKDVDVDAQSVDMVACSTKALNDECSYVLGGADANGDAVTISGTCQAASKNLVCTATKEDTGGGGGETALESSCDTLDVGAHCEITYGDIVVEGGCEVNPDGNKFCMPDTGGYLRH